MSNAAIVQRMRDACAQWWTGDIDCLSLAAQLIGHAEALEGVPRRIVEEAHHWRGELECASDPAAFGDSALAIKQLNAVVPKISEWVERIAAEAG